MDLATELSLAFIVIGVVMLLIEAAAPGNFILVPATVLIILGCLGLLIPDFLLSWWAPIAAAVVLIPTTFLTIRLYQRLAPPGPPETTVATSLIGKRGVVTVEVRPDDLKGKVRIEHDTWSAMANCTIPVGKQVIVTNSEGVHVVVEETEKKEGVC
ncbi:MAG: NfeD family protein [Methanomassiliicoccales archaeon]|nr:NfeD family protein [Methanomassiliicoccales archaeon]